MLLQNSFKSRTGIHRFLCISMPNIKTSSIFNSNTSYITQLRSLASHQSTHHFQSNYYHHQSRYRHQKNSKSSSHHEYNHNSKFHQDSILYRKGTIYLLSGAFLLLIQVPGLIHQDRLSFPSIFTTLHCEAQSLKPQLPLSPHNNKKKTTINTTINQPFLNNYSIDKPELSTWKVISEIWTCLKPDWFLFVSIIVISSASAIVNINIPVVIGHLISAVQQNLSLTGDITSAASTAKNSLSRSIRDPALKLVIMFLSQGFLTFCDIALVSQLGERMVKRLRQNMFESLVHRDIAFFDANRQGEIIGRLSQDVAEFKHTFKLTTTQGLKAFTQVVGTAFQLFGFSTYLTLNMLGTMPFLYFGMNLYGMYLRKISKTARNGESLASSVAGEAISNIKTVRSFSAEDREIVKYSDYIESASHLNTQLGFHIGLFQGMTNLSIGLMIITVLYHGGNLVSTGAMTGGQLMTYMIATQNAQKALASLGVLFGQVIKAIGSASRVIEYMDVDQYKHNTTRNPHYNLQLNDLKGNIEFENVYFSYPTRPDHLVLENFNLSIPKGKVIALCGESGSGKSTIGQLIERFYDPFFGRILIDGIPIDHFDPKRLRDQIGYINQEPVLFATTIFDNIRYGNPSATKEQVVEAAKKANASQFIEEFPDGYDTMCGERGATLSGGQKQRIAIAPQSERMVQEAMDKLMQGRTTLIIAHRLSTIQNADLIVVLQPVSKGSRRYPNIAETGNHNELLKRKGIYYRLYQRMQETQE